jgi:SAM-dependent methyltransferase
LGLREDLSLKYLKGEGIEIGALAWPLQVNDLARVKYVDRLTREQLLKQYPDLPPARIVEPDIICDGATLDAMSDSSFDFVVANHLLEHMPDPLRALDNWFRVLRPKGVLYLLVPDMLHTFDADRPLTSVDHMIKDNSNSTERDPRLDFVHYIEWVKYVYPKFPNLKPCPRTEIYKEAARLQRHVLESRGSIHFHTFVQETMTDLLRAIEKRCGAKPLEFCYNEASHEFISILQKL